MKDDGGLMIFCILWKNVITIREIEDKVVDKIIDKDTQQA